MNLQFYNTSQPESFNALILPRERPGFLDYEPAMAEMEKQVKQYEHITDVVIIAGISRKSTKVIILSNESLGL